MNTAVLTITLASLAGGNELLRYGGPAVATLIAATACAVVLYSRVFGPMLSQAAAVAAQNAKTMAEGREAAEQSAEASREARRAAEASRDALRMLIEHMDRHAIPGARPNLRGQTGHG